MKIKYVENDDRRSKKFNDLIKKEYPQFIEETNLDLILVSGGDGSLLHAVQNYNHFQVPFLGRSAGTLNFLMNRFDDDVQILNDLSNNDLELDYIATRGIKVEFENQAGDKQSLGMAVNDVVLGTSIMGYHGFNINTKDYSFRNFELKGTGICISTELGSTAYNFNLGGPVIPLGSNLWTVVGIATNRYLNDILKAQKMAIKPFQEGSFSIFIDGIKSKKKLVNGDRVILTRGNRVKIAFLNKSSFLKKRVELISRYRKS
jgi:NAD+ kinase